MKILILNGSPHHGGNTAALTKELKKLLQGQVLELFAFEEEISPCLDCGHCKKEFSCALAKDKMEKVFAALAEYDGLIIASPIWAESLTPPLLSLLSRLQPYFYHKDRRPQNLQKGGILLTGGGSGGASHAEAAAAVLFKQLNVANVYPLIGSYQTDRILAKEDANVLSDLRQMADWFNH